MNNQMRFFFPIAVLYLTAAFQVQQAHSEDRLPPKLEPFIGWWIGEGRLGFRGGKTENIRCRAVYRRAKEFAGLKQTIRCATNSGTVEIASKIELDGNNLVGQWDERKYGLSGALKGNAVPGGFRVEVLGSDLRANMTVLTRDNRQVVEVQFNKTSLIGLSVILTRGTPKS